MRREPREKRTSAAEVVTQAAGTALALLFALATTVPAQTPEPVPDASDDVAPEMKLEGGARETVFGSLTITGEDRISIEFDRPELSLDLDPGEAPGLEWGDPLGVLQRSGIDLATPYLEASAAIPSRGLADDWVTIFREGAVARFCPRLEGVESWQLTIVDSRSDTIAVFDGRGEPPKEIAWDGRRRDGQPAAPGLVYSYVLEAADKAGNRRTFPGEGFEIPPYRIDETDRVIHLFAARSLPMGWSARAGSAPPALLLEVASFHPTTVRRTSARIGLRTDASTRFEKYLDPTLPATAAAHLVHVLQQIQPDLTFPQAPGDAGEWSDPACTVELRPTRVREVLGAEISDGEIERILTALGFGKGSFPEAERAAAETLALPIAPGITPDQQAQVVDCIAETLGG